MAEPQAVIFDLGRVLVGVDLTRGLWARIQAELEGPGTEVVRRDRWLRLYDSFATGQIGPAELHEHFGVLSGWEIPYPEFETQWCDIFAPLPGMAALFGEVSRRVPVGLLSDTDPLHWAFVRRHYPWVGQIPRPTLSFEIGALKPAPAAYRAAAANTGAAIERCLFTDDLERNIVGARQVGMAAVRFDGAEKLRAELRSRGLLG